MMSVMEDSNSLVSLQAVPRNIDPLLKDLNEKKQSFRRNVVSLAVELKDVRTRLASQEQTFAKETLSRQEAESKAKTLEEEIGLLQKRLEERNMQLQISTSSAEKYLKDMDNLRLQLSATEATAEENAVSAHFAQLQCLALLKEIDEKTSSLKEHEDRVTRLGEQLCSLQKELQARESCQKQLKDEVLRVERDIMQAVNSSGVDKECELRKLLEEVSPKNFEKINKHVVVKDEQIAKLKDEIRIMSAHWKLKTQELESQLEKQRRTDQELKKRILKLEFCLQEARSQTRKLQKMGERQDKAIKEVQDQLAAKAKQQDGSFGVEKENFWETSGFKMVRKIHQEKKLELLVDKDLKTNYDRIELDEMVQVALLCTQYLPGHRPKMSEVVRMLEGDGLAERWEATQKAEANKKPHEFSSSDRYSDLTDDSSSVVQGDFILLSSLEKHAIEKTEYS